MFRTRFSRFMGNTLQLTQQQGKRIFAGGNQLLKVGLCYESLEGLLMLKNLNIKSALHD